MLGTPLDALRLLRTLWESGTYKMKIYNKVSVVLSAQTNGLYHSCYLPAALLIINHKALAKQGENALGSIRPSIHVFGCVFVSTLTAEPFDLRP